MDSSPDYGNIYGWRGDYLTLTFHEIQHISGVDMLGGGARSGDYLEQFVVLYRDAFANILTPILSDDDISPRVCEVTFFTCSSS